MPSDGLAGRSEEEGAAKKYERDVKRRTDYMRPHYWMPKDWAAVSAGHKESLYQEWKADFPEKAKKAFDEVQAFAARHGGRDSGESEPPMKRARGRGRGRGGRGPVVSPAIPFEPAGDGHVEEPSGDGHIEVESCHSVVDSGQEDARDAGAEAKKSGPCQGQWRRGKKVRRVLVGEEGEDEAEANQDKHPDASMDAELLELLDRRDEDIPAGKLSAVAEIRTQLRQRRLARPYHAVMPYGGPGKLKRVRHPHVGRGGLGGRPFCVETMYQLCR
jgi:hypothetical protein